MAAQPLGSPWSITVELPAELFRVSEELVQRGAFLDTGDVIRHALRMLVQASSTLDDFRVIAGTTEEILGKRTVRTHPGIILHRMSESEKARLERSLQDLRDGRLVSGPGSSLASDQ
ncbi:MAG: hypothetical protein MH204_00650 [Fimbriimonadaceae bacterium]|nr:hypothetical protein [Fimbriimonadaceae bacterium]